MRRGGRSFSSRGHRALGRQARREMRYGMNDLMKSRPNSSNKIKKEKDNPREFLSDKYIIYYRIFIISMYLNFILIFIILIGNLIPIHTYIPIFIIQLIYLVLGAISNFLIHDKYIII